MALKRVLFRRRRKYKTDYKARARMLKGKIPRIVVRKTNRYIIAQIVQSQVAQDKVILNANSKELLKYGWPDSYSVKNLKAGYLTGFLCAAKAKKEKIDKAALDSGMIRSTKWNKVYSVVRGALDGGLHVPHSEEVLPKVEAIYEKQSKYPIDLEKIKGEILNKVK